MAADGEQFGIRKNGHPNLEASLKLEDCFPEDDSQAIDTYKRWSPSRKYLVHTFSSHKLQSYLPHQESGTCEQSVNHEGPAMRRERK